MFLEQGHGLAQIGDIGFFGVVNQKSGGDIDAVEDVADVVQDAGGHFGHAGLAGGLQQLLVQILHRGFGFLDGGDVLGNAESPDDLAVVVVQRHFAGQRPGDSAVAPGFLFRFGDDGLSRTDDFLFVIEGWPGVFLAEEIKIATCQRPRPRS